MNLRKDHYRLVPAAWKWGLPGVTTHACPAPAQAGAQGLLEFVWQARSAATEDPRFGPCAPARSSGRSGALLSRRPRLPLVSGSLRLRASLPRRRGPGRNHASGPGRPARGRPTGTQLASLLRRVRGGFNVPGVGARTGGLGAPGGVCPPRVFPSNLFLDAPAVAKPNQRVQLLAVDHSARASMKNAASCEK